MADIKDLEGKTIIDIIVWTNDLYENDYIRFHCSDGTKYLMTHYQDCCEDVSIEDINGSILDVLNHTVIQAEERTNTDNNEDYESCTYTFYTIRTTNGDLDIRWFGESNGYYSESVDFELIKNV